MVYLSDFTPLIFETNLRPPVPPIVFERDPRFVPLVRIVSLRTAVVFAPSDLVLVVGGEQEVEVSLNILPQEPQTITLSLTPEDVEGLTVSPSTVTFTEDSTRATVSILASRADQRGNLVARKSDGDVDLEQPGRLGITVLPQATVVFAPSSATVISGCVDYTACVSTPVQVYTDPPLGPDQVATLLLDSSSVGGLLLSLEDPAPDPFARERTTQVWVELSESTPDAVVYLHADRDAQPVSGVVEVTVRHENISTPTGLDIVAGPGLPVEVRRPRFELFFALTGGGDGIGETVITANTTQQFVVAVRSLDGVGLPDAQPRSM